MLYACYYLMHSTGPKISSLQTKEERGGSTMTVGGM